MGRRAGRAVSNRSALDNQHLMVTSCQSGGATHITRSLRFAIRIAGLMDDQTTDVIQGTLDMLILKTLSLEPMHGFGVARRIEQITRDVFKVNGGSLLVAFKRMEREGLLEAEWRDTENSRRAKFYSLTRAGKKRLEMERAQWSRRANAITRLLTTEA